MFMNYYLLSIMNVISGTLITISSSSWLMAWFGMELNLLSFIPLMKNKNNPFSMESTMKYFIIQATSSSLLMASFMINPLFNTLLSQYLTTNLIFMMLMMKIASAPLHFWLPPISETLQWPTIVLILTWQKIAPLSILFFLHNNMMIFIIMNLIIGPMMMFNQTSIKKMMVYSSIAHLAWMITSLSLNSSIFILYFSIYMISSMPLSYIFYVLKISSSFEIMNMNKKTWMIILMNILSLGGFPPFNMFFPKYILIMDLTSKNLMLPLLLMSSSLLAMFAYLRTSWPNFLFFHSFHKSNFSMPLSLLKINSTVIFPLMFPIMSPMLLLFY